MAVAETCSRSGLKIWTVEHICWFALYYLNIVVQPHQKRWLEHVIRGGPRVLLLAPRGHGKTTTIIKIMLVYLICYDPDIKILLASHKEAVARRQGRLIQLALERKKIQQDFNIGKGRPWRRDEFYITEDGQDKDEPVVFCVAGQGGMTGYRFNWIVFDDLLVKDNQRTETMRYKLVEWLEDEVLKARDPGAKQKVLVVGTRKHHKDWYSQLMATDYYECRVDKAKLDDGGYLWPWRLDEHGNRIERMFDAEELESRLRTEGARSFAQEYQNAPAPPEGLWLKREWIQTYDHLPPEQYLNIYMGIDPAMEGDSKEGSSMAVAVVAFDNRPDHKHIYVVDMWKSKPNPALGEQLRKIEELHEKWNPESCNMEAVMVNKKFAKHVQDRLPNVYLVDYIHTRLQGTTEVNKDLRIKNYIGLYFEDGFVSLKDPAYDYTVREFIETEYIEFPDGDKDMLDALNLAVDLVDTSEGSHMVPLVGW